MDNVSADFDAMSNSTGANAFLIHFKLQEIEKENLTVQKLNSGAKTVPEVGVSWRSSGPEFCVIWPWKRPASGRGSFWEPSSFVPWLVFNASRDGSGVVPECPGSSGFIRKSSSRASAPRMRFSVLLNSFDSLLWPFPQFPQKLELYSLPAI